MKMKSIGENTERLTLRISKELMDSARAKARGYGLSLSSFVRMVIAKAVGKEV